MRRISHLYQLRSALKEGLSPAGNSLTTGIMTRRIHHGAEGRGDVQSRPKHSDSHGGDVKSPMIFDAKGLGYGVRFLLLQKKKKKNARLELKNHDSTPYKGTQQHMGVFSLDSSRRGIKFTVVTVISFSTLSRNVLLYTFDYQPTVYRPPRPVYIHHCNNLHSNRSSPLVVTTATAIKFPVRSHRHHKILQ
jgi:hypothetical protein